MEELNTIQPIPEEIENSLILTTDIVIIEIINSINESE